MTSSRSKSSSSISSISSSKSIRGWSTLPTELKIIVLSHLSHAKDLLSVALVCHSFLAVARCRLYEHVTYQQHSRELGATEIKSIERFAKSLCGNPQLADSVKTAYLGMPIRSKDGSRYEGNPGFLHDIACLDDGALELQILSMMEILGRARKFRGMRLRAWPGLEVGDLQETAKVISIDVEALLTSTMDWQELEQTLHDLLMLPGLESITFGYHRGLQWTDLEASEVAQAMLRRPERISDVKNLTINAGSLPSPAIFANLASQLRTLRYLYCDFCGCMLSQWQDDVLDMLTQILGHHCSTIETLCLQLSWGTNISCENGSFSTFTNLKFLSVALDFAFPWKNFTPRYSSPPLPDFRAKPIQEMLPGSVETVIFKICSSFRWIDHEPAFYEHPKDGREWHPSPEARSVFRWLKGLISQKCCFPALSNVVLMQACCCSGNHLGQQPWDACKECKDLVKNFHRHGINLIFDELAFT